MRNDSMHDRASVRGTKAGRNRKLRPTESMIARRNQRLARVAKIGGALAGVVGFAYGAMCFRELALSSPRFAIDNVHVSGTKRATKESIVRLSGVTIGQNIFTATTEEIAKMVEAHPWVKRAEATRKYPRAIAIEIEEHEPVVLVALGHLYYANAEGEIVKRYTPGEKEPLPVVTGLSREEMETDDGDAKARLRSAIAFLGEWRAVMGTEAAAVAEIHLDEMLGLSFVAGEGQATVLLGAPPYKQSIERFVRVKEALGKKGVRASRIMLGGERRPDRAVARLESAATAAASSTGRAHEIIVEGVGTALVSLE